jgi:hypothetical protein
MKLKNIALSATLIAGAVVSLSVNAQSSTIDTYPSWDGISWISGWSAGGTYVYGQTITPTSEQTNLTSFGFSLSAFNTGSPPQYTAGIYQWNGSLNVGPALFTSSVLTAPDSLSFVQVSINTGGVRLISGQQYVLFLSTIGQPNTATNAYRWAFISTGPYTLGNFVYSNDGTSITNTWSGNRVGDNLAFFALFGPAGPSSEDTQASISSMANRLRGIYSLQSTSLVNGLSYDCQIFDVNNICLSTGGRYSNNNGVSGYTTSALLIGAYRLNKNVRIGAWVDQNLSTNTTTGVNLGNSKPLFGVFGAWAESPTGEGYEVKVSAGYGDKDLNVTRDVIGTSEAGFGTSRLKSLAVSSVSSYGFRINNEMLVSPYVGIRYSRIASNGYTEFGSDTVTTPLSYNKLNQENIALLAGLRLSVKLDPKTTFVASAGVEQNLKNRTGQYSATGVDGLTPIEFNSNPQKTRAIASIGAYYDIDKKQRVSINGVYREETFNPTATTSVLATYTVGF